MLNGESKNAGVAIITYEHARFAQEAVTKLDKFEFDNKPLRVFQVDKMVEMMSRSEEFDASKFKVDSFSRADERDWLLDEEHREQLLLRYADETEIYWVSGDGGPP